jgi:hypothetical protein
MIAPSVMSLSALPAFTDDCISTIDAGACTRIVDPRTPRRPELGAILVTRHAAPSRSTDRRTNRVVRDECRATTAAAPAGAAMMRAVHTHGHIAYAGHAGSRERIDVRRATLFASRRGDDSDVLAAPRAWKNDFR